MSDNKTTLVIPEPQKIEVDELKTLKERADLMGITYSNNIGVDALKAKIKEKLEGKANESTADKDSKSQEKKKEDKEDQYELPLNMVTDEAILRERIYKDNMYLVRVRISNLNPAKKDIPGEFVTVSNKYLGTVRKYIPFGEATDNGYHVPKVLLEVLKSRKFLSLKTKRDRNTGTAVPSQQWVKEFAIEELPPLTEEELEQLKRQQAAARGM